MHGTATFWLTLGGLLVVLILVLMFFGARRVDRFFNEHQWAGPMVVLVVTLAVVFQVQGLVLQGQRFTHSLHESQLEACQRGNPEKVGELRNLENDAKNIESDIDFALEAAPPSPARAIYLTKKKKRLEKKEDAIESKIASRRKYAVEPGSVVIDCSAAYPG